MKYYKAIADINVDQFSRHSIPGFLTIDPMIVLAYAQAGDAEDYAYVYEFDIDTSNLKNVGDKDLCFFSDRSIKPGYYSNLATDAYKHGGLGTIVVNIPVKGKIIAAYKTSASAGSTYKQIHSPIFSQDFDNAEKGTPTWHREDMPNESNNKIGGNTMTPSQIAQLITENVKEDNGLCSSKQVKDTILITTSNTEVILRIPPRTPREHVVEMLGLSSSKNIHFDGKLLEHIQQHWTKIHPPDEIIYEISIAPRGTNNFNYVGMAYVQKGCARVKLIGEMAEQPWMVKEITQAIKKLDLIGKSK